MKKLLVLATVAGVVGLSLVASFAVEKQGPIVKPPQQRIWLKGDIIQKIISAVNDKSQPANSLTQRYRVLIETTKGQKQTVTIQIQMNENGQIVKATDVSPTKQQGGIQVIVLQAGEPVCNSPCRMVETCVAGNIHGKTYEFCFSWCCCRPVC